MKVKNRHGEMIPVSYDAIMHRISRLCSPDELAGVDIDTVVIQTIQGIYDGITTEELDDLSSRICASLQSHHFYYDSIASKILLSNMSKTVSHRFAVATFSEKIAFYSRSHAGVLHTDFVEFVRAHAAALDAMVRYERDAQYTYFSVRTLQRSYLMKVDGTCLESPQDMWMRVSVALWMGGGDSAEVRLGKIEQCYTSLSRGLYTHATPTLYNAGMRVQQCSSCYLLGTCDSLDGIFKTLGDCAQISKWAGGIGLHVSNVRAKGSRIRSTDGVSDGLVPMLKVFNECARYCNQSGRRKGSIAVYLEPWHADVWEFVELRRNTGAETERARDLFLALWVPDEFMRRVESDGDWYLMSHDACPGLVDAVGDAFSALYARYVEEGRYVRKMRARVLWQHVLACQLETGTPYVMFKDHVNRKCNQSNVGTIRSSNLCAEITQYSDESQYAVCNLASLSIPRFVDTASQLVRHEALHETTRELVRNLDRIIDINNYPTPETRRSNLSMRPIGIGVQGLGDVYCMLKIPYEDPRSVALDADILETIYHAALTASVELAAEHGPYERFEGSPASQGKLQMDLWGLSDDKLSGRYDWSEMRRRVRETGLRHSMLTALMPTASTSQILGNCESFEPFQANVFKRSTMAGEFVVVNRHLMEDLMRSGHWSETIRRELLAHDGSVQKISAVSPELKGVYRTVWEVSQRAVIDHAAARGPFVDQSQSMNLYMASPNSQKLSSALMYAWRCGLKTGIYYLRSQAAVEAIKVGILGTAPLVAAKPSSTAADDGGAVAAETAAVGVVCRRRKREANDGEVCDVCSA